MNYMGMGRIPSLQSTLDNKAEVSKASKWLTVLGIVWSLLFVGIQFTIFFPLFYVNSRNWWGLLFLFMMFGFSCGLPAYASFYGYMMAKSTEYNRYMDVSQLVGTIQAQLSGGSNQVIKGILETMKLGMKIGSTLEEPDNFQIVDSNIDFNEE